MDAIMRENAGAVCMQGVERIEPKPGGDPSLKYVYLAPTDVGPVRTQMRMVMQVVPGKTQEANVNVLEMWVGIVDRNTGEIAYKPETKMKFESGNVVRWEANGANGLTVVNRSTATVVLSLPWWFPLPDV